MNTPNNKRKRESKDRVEKAFLRMIQDTDPARITVSDLCKEADINRSTFYASYTDLYDLIGKVRERLYRERQEFYGDQPAELFTLESYVRLFEDIEQNPVFYRTYFKLRSGKGDDPVFAYDAAQAQAVYGDGMAEYHLEYYKSGLTSVIVRWLDGGCVPSARQMAEMMVREYQRSSK